MDLFPPTWSLTNLDTNVRFESQFGPSEMTHNLSTNHSEAWSLNRDTPILQWVRGELETWTFEALLWSQHALDDIESDIQWINGLVKRDETLQRPPVCLFAWGNYQVECVVASVGGVKYLLKSILSTTKSARFSITLKKYDPYDIKVTDPNKRPGSTFYVSAKIGETYEELAKKKYVNPLWGDLVRRQNPQEPYVLSGKIIALPNTEDLVNVDIEPESPPLKRTEEGLEARRTIFELRKKDYVSHIV